jgi:hypothetical protein
LKLSFLMRAFFSYVIPAAISFKPFHPLNYLRPN